MRRHTQINSVPTPEYGWEEIARITEAGFEATIAIPNIYEKIGLFIVGGGSSGACEHYKAGWAGNGGNGGQVIHKIVDYTNSRVTVFVGRGGNRTSTGTDKPSNPGADSYIVYNSQTFVAAGGLGPPTAEGTYNT